MESRCLGTSRYLVTSFLYSPHFLFRVSRWGHLKLGCSLAYLLKKRACARLDSAYMMLRSNAPAMMKSENNEGTGVPGVEPLSQSLVFWMSGMPGVEEACIETIYEWGHDYRVGNSQSHRNGV